MTFRVETTIRAEEDLHEIYCRIRAASAPLAAKWFTGLEDAINSLEIFPERGAIINRHRQLLYGSKPDVYRIVYSFDMKHHVIHVLYVRHGARSKVPLRRFH